MFSSRHYIEANRNMQNYHRLFWASQERYDKLVNLSSSGGAVGLRTVPDGSDNVFELAEAYADYQRTTETESAPQVDSGIDFNSSDSGCVLDVNSNVNEQNGVKPAITSSPNLSFSRRHKKDLKPVTTEKLNASKSRNGDVSYSSNKTPGEKPSLHRSNSETSSLPTKTHGDKANFAVPKPPVVRKGARRHLALDQLPAVSKPPTSSVPTLTSSAGGTSCAPIPAPSAVDLATCRRTQSR